MNIINKNYFLKWSLNCLPSYNSFIQYNRDIPKELLNKHLLGIVNYSIKNIKYYAKRYSNVNSLDDFQKLEFIDKDVVNQNLDELINVKRKNFGDWVTTGGTSGKPLNLILPKSRFIQEYATMFTMWQRAGWDFHRTAVIRNHKLSGNFKIDKLKNQLIFDGFRLNDDYFSYIYRTIKEYKIQFIHAYPSSAFDFCRFLKRYKKDTSFITAILGGSENVFSHQIDLIENELDIRFYNWYGHSEKLLLGGYCEYTKYYHIEPYYGYFELIDENGKPINKPGKRGEIVGTTLHNKIMPLIRYRTGDYAEYVSDKCDKCGRHVPLIKNIQGRWNGLKIYNSDGTYVSTTALNLHSNLYTYIDGIQYIQNKKGHLDILIIPSNGFNRRIEEMFYNFFSSKFKKGTIIKIIKVDRLKRKSNGKFVQLLSTLNQ